MNNRYTIRLNKEYKKNRTYLAANLHMFDHVFTQEGFLAQRLVNLNARSDKHGFCSVLCPTSFLVKESPPRTKSYFLSGFCQDTENKNIFTSLF